MSKRKISIEDIARRAGVSHSTVSRALRDNSLISPKVREEIKGVGDRSRSNQQRLEGYRIAMTEAGRSPKTEWIVMSDEEYGRTNDVAIGQQLLSKLFNAGVTGIFCYNDMVAVGALLACHERGISVPQDLSLVGFDGIALSGYVTPPLTTVCQPMLELGRSAMQMLLDVLQEKSVENQVLSPFLVKRGSSAVTVTNQQ